MRIGITIGRSNFRGAANAAAIPEEWCAKHAADRAIGAFYAMMRASYWKRGV
jgi:hypothetical protein